MHGFEEAGPAKFDDPNDRRPWYQLLTRYHWFVLIVAALGWLFDTMDQQLFNLARVPAMKELLASSPGEAVDPGTVAAYGGYATSIFLIGWATGGLFFGVLGDRVGRAKTMLLTILLYSLCTGLSAFSVGFWDFAFYRFITGLGVGGEFAVGVSLVAEVMPSKARPFALGLLQALSAVGNITAALISIGFGQLEETGVLGGFELFGIRFTAWRLMFLVGTLPALLAIFIRRRLKEPETWQAAVQKSEGGARLGSYSELFGDPRWRYRAIVGLVLASSGIIGLWGIGFFSIDLNRSVFRKVFDQEARDAGEANLDRDFLRLALNDPSDFKAAVAKIQPNDLLSVDPGTKDAAAIFGVMQSLSKENRPIAEETILATLDEQGQTAEDRQRREDLLTGNSATSGDLASHAERINARTNRLNGRLTRWAGYTSVMLNLGAFFGIYGFSMLTHYIGRRPAFALAFVAAGLSTALVFWSLKTTADVFWMIPLMGFCQLSLFGGYAIYFPELFPTRLRSTGISFCYNVGRYVAACGPSILGLLTSSVFKDYPEPMRYAGVAMCSIFVVGLLALPFAPETKGKPLPE